MIVPRMGKMFFCSEVKQKTMPSKPCICIKLRKMKKKNGGRSAWVSFFVTHLGVQRLPPTTGIVASKCHDQPNKNTCTGT